MTIGNVDNTTLNALIPNLDIGDVADPALRLAAFQYIYAEMQIIVAELNSIPAANLQNLSISATKLANLAVETGKIADLAVTTQKINDLAVTAAKIAMGTITSAQIADLGIATADLADSIITTVKLADASVITAKIADIAVTLAKMAANSVGTTQLIDLAVTRPKIAVGAVGSSQLDPTLLTNFGDIAVQAEFDRRGINVTKFSGATAEDKLANAIAYAEVNDGVVLISPDLGDIKYDTQAETVDIRDERLGDFRNLPYINNRQIDIGSYRHMKDFKMLVAGDSLAYNRYDYDATSRSTAEAGKYGYKSWSYLIRDAFLQNLPGFIHAIDYLPSYESTAALQQEETALTQYFLPLEGKTLEYNFTSLSQKAVFFIPQFLSSGAGGRSTNDWYLYFLSNTTFGGTFDVKLYDETGAQIGTTASIDNTSDGTYLGWHLKSASINTLGLAKPHKVEITPTLFTNGSANNLYIIGSALSNMTWKNTGDGGENSTWLLTNIATLVNTHNPDIVFITIGANDGTGVSDFTETKTYENVRDSIASIRTNNPKTEIILVSMAQTSTYADAETQTRVRALRRVANEYECGFVDSNNIFRRLDTADWRFDNIHFKKLGNQILFEAIAKLFFPSLDISLINQFNNKIRASATAEQRDRLYMKWRTFLTPKVLCTYTPSNPTMTVSTSLNTIFVPQNNSYFNPFSNSMVSLSVALGFVVLTVQQPFNIHWLVPRYEPSVLVENTANLFTLKFKSYALNATTFYIAKADGTLVTTLADLTNFSIILSLEM